MSAELPTAAAPLIAPYLTESPVIGPRLRGLGPGCSLVGQVRLGARAEIGAGAVIRADGHFVTIGDDFCLGESSTIHISHSLFPTIVGDRVTVGRGSVVHACTVRDDCVVEDGVVILDGATVEPGSLIEAGSTVFGRSNLPGGFVYAGSPAHPQRALEPGELERRAAGLRPLGASPTGGPGDAAMGSARAGPDTFVATTARLRGSVELAPEASVFFGCDLDAGKGAIVIGENSNIQDNSTIRCTGAGATIGRNSTLGHNVSMSDGRVGDGCLVGIGSRLGGGTVIEDDVFLAAGATTEPGQVLTKGWLWGGRPARQIAPLDDKKRNMMRMIVEQYCGYARAYRATKL